MIGIEDLANQAVRKVSEGEMIELVVCSTTHDCCANTQSHKL